MFGTLKGLDQSMNPKLMMYGRETDVSIAQARREHRRKLFGSSQIASKAIIPEHVESYREQFGQKVLVKCDSLRFRLQIANENGDLETSTQVKLLTVPYKNIRNISICFSF